MNFEFFYSKLIFIIAFQVFATTGEIKRGRVQGMNSTGSHRVSSMSQLKSHNQSQSYLNTLKATADAIRSANPISKSNSSLRSHSNNESKARTVVAKQEHVPNNQNSSRIKAQMKPAAATMPVTTTANPPGSGTVLSKNSPATSKNVPWKPASPSVAGSAPSPHRYAYHYQHQY